MASDLVKLMEADAHSPSDAVGLALDVIDDWLDAGRVADIERLLTEADPLAMSTDLAVGMLTFSKPRRDAYAAAYSRFLAGTRKSLLAESAESAANANGILKGLE